MTEQDGRTVVPVKADTELEFLCNRDRNVQRTEIGLQQAACLDTRRAANGFHAGKPGRYALVRKGVDTFIIK